MFAALTAIEFNQLANTLSRATQDMTRLIGFIGTMRITDETNQLFAAAVDTRDECSNLFLDVIDGYAIGVQ